MIGTLGSIHVQASQSSSPILDKVEIQSPDRRPTGESFTFGRPQVNAANGKFDTRCCGKPVGCNMMEGCLYLDHPWKKRYSTNKDQCRVACSPSMRET